MRGTGLVLVVALASLPPAPAAANGAFPDTGQLLLPRPGTIVLGTNFGLVISEDGGARWRWTCEHGDGDLGDRYALAAGGAKLVGLSPRALIASADLGCRWQRVAEEAERLPFDFFADPTDPAVVIALVTAPRTRTDSIVRVALDQPAAAPQTLYDAPRDEELTTIEVAASDPSFLYATQNPILTGGRTRVVRSGDRGRTWTVVDPRGAPEYINLRIAAVDPKDPRKLFFRAGMPLDQGDGLLVSDDGGDTVRTVFSTRGGLTAFLRLARGGALVALMEGPAGALYRLGDDGAATPLPAATLRVRALAERDGAIYAASDNLADGYAIGVSRDQGETWTRVMAFEDIAAITSCGDLPAVCVGVCNTLALRGALPAPLCRHQPPPPDAAAGGAEDAAAGQDAAAGGPSGADAAAGGPSASGGCGCDLGGGAREAGGPVLLVIGIAALATARRRRRRLSGPG